MPIFFSFFHNCSYMRFSPVDIIQQFSNIWAVQFSCSVMSNSLWPRGLQHARLPCPLPTPRVYPNSCALSQWCYPTISSSVVPFSFCLQSCPASESHGPQPCLTQWNYKPCCVRPPKMDGSWCWVLTKRGPQEKGMIKNFSSILALRSPRAVWNTWTCYFIFITLFLNIVQFVKCLLNLILSSDSLYSAVSRPSSIFFNFIFHAVYLNCKWLTFPFFSF